jgi:hypothetical protein
MWDNGTSFAQATRGAASELHLDTLQHRSANHGNSLATPPSRDIRNRFNIAISSLAPGAAGVCKLWSPFHIEQLLFFHRIRAVLNDTKNEARVFLHIPRHQVFVLRTW